MTKKLLLIALLVVGVVLGWSKFKSSGETKETSSPIQDQIYKGQGYVPVDEIKYEVSTIAEGIATPTRLKITPDGEHLLVTQITGEILAFKREGDSWAKKPYIVTKIETSFPGFPPDEAGLVGLAFSNNYKENGLIFLLYNYKQEDGKVQNRISRVRIINFLGKLKGINKKQIWQANVFGTGSHQITDAMPIILNGEDRITFLIGEGFDGKKAQDPKLEAGKLISIKEDGRDAKIHAMGIRNGYVLVKNPNDPDGKILISDTGPDKYDRLIYTNPFVGEILNFGWNGDQESLNITLPDPNFKEVKDMVILRLPETRTFTGLGFDEDGNLYATLFGKTGEKENTPGKEILKGTLTLSGQPKVAFTPIVKRNPEAKGFLGNPIGLEVDSKTGSIIFADIMEGKIYQIKTRG